MNTTLLARAICNLRFPFLDLQWVFGTRACFGVALAVAAAVCCGCSAHAQRVSQLRADFYANRLEAAAAAVTDGVRRDRSGADVFKLDGALVDLAGGDPRRAERTLREVRDHFDALEGPELAAKAAAYLTDDNRRSYAGEDYEKVLIRAFLALANLMQDGGDVEAYSLQMIDKQEQVIAAGAGKDGENPKQNYPRVALAPYLRGVLREATHLNYDDAERSYLAVASWQPGFAPARFDLERATHGHHSAPGNGVLYVFALTGRGPHKIEAVEVPSSAALFIAGEIVSAVGHQTVPPNVAPVKVPKLVAQTSLVDEVAVNVGAQPVGVTQTITDVTQLAIQQQEAVYPLIVARAVARRCLKKGAVYGVKEAAGVPKGSLAGLGFDLAGIAWEAAESADLRCWALLPDKIQVLRVELPAGQHNIRLQPVVRAGSAAPISRQVSIADGRNTYLLASFPDGQLVGQVLISQP